MRSRTPLRLGLVGCGRIAERGWIPAFAMVPEARLAAVADVRPERCAIARHARAFESAGELARSGAVDAVVVATPAAAHVADAAAVTTAGLPVLVEKPPAVDAAAARALAALTPMPLLGFNRRFDPGLRDLRARIPADVPLRVELAFRYRREGWAAYDVADDVLLDVGPHLLDLARWLTGSDLRRVRAVTLERDRCELELALARGTAEITCDADAPYRETVAVRALDGGRIGRWRRGGAGDAVRARLARRPSPLVASLADELRAFCALARGERATGLADGTDGVAVMEAIEAARASAESGGAWVELSGALAPSR